MIEIEIDGKKLEAEPGSMIIEVADAAGINIPRFCYHKKLSVAANCRMCLVEVEKSGKPLPACATPVTAGMKVMTKSPKAVDAQKAVMEFLLINHPLDCPICDQGGECELQDLSMGYGEGISRYTLGKRSVKDKDIGPLISTDMTRCIHCTRCVRFGQEVAGLRELGATGRGENMEIGTYIEHSIISEVSGNVIDLCPVGALTSKPFRFTARAWELNQFSSIAPHDCLGSNIHIHTRNKVVMRVVPRENELINETWISDRDRYSYTGLVEDRLTQPLKKVNGKWETIDWTEALELVTQKLKKIIKEAGANQLGAIVSPNATIEEMYLLQKIWRKLGSNNLDHRLKQIDVSDQQNTNLYPGLNSTIQDIEQSDAILLVGSNLHREVPLLGVRVRKASLEGARVSTINPIGVDYNFETHQDFVVHPQKWIHVLAGLLKTLLVSTTLSLPNSLTQLINQVKEPDKKITVIAEALKAGKKVTILIGALANHHPHAAQIRTIISWIAKCCGANVGILTDGANSAGAWIAGVIPHRSPAGTPISVQGLQTSQMFAEKLRGYFLVNVEPDLDCASPHIAKEACEAAETVIALSSYQSPFFEKYADIILPMANFTETSGTFVNFEGRWQSFTGVSLPVGESRPGWKILRVLGNLLEIEGFEYDSSEEVREELRSLVSVAKEHEQTPWDRFTIEQDQSSKVITRIAEWPIYRVDPLVRHSIPLQTCATSESPEIKMNQKLATDLQLQNGERAIATQDKESVEFPVKIDNKVPDDCVYIASGFPETAMLGGNGPIQIRRVTT